MAERFEGDHWIGVLGPSRASTTYRLPDTQRADWLSRLMRACCDTGHITEVHGSGCPVCVLLDEIADAPTDPRKVADHG